MALTTMVLNLYAINPISTIALAFITPGLVLRLCVFILELYLHSLLCVPIKSP